jgi:hypothetical protein
MDQIWLNHLNNTECSLTWYLCVLLYESYRPWGSPINCCVLYFISLRTCLWVRGTGSRCEMETQNPPPCLGGTPVKACLPSSSPLLTVSLSDSSLTARVSGEDLTFHTKQVCGQNVGRGFNISYKAGKDDPSLMARMSGEDSTFHTKQVRTIPVWWPECRERIQHFIQSR